MAVANNNVINDSIIIYMSGAWYGEIFYYFHKPQAIENKAWEYNILPPYQALTSVIKGLFYTIDIFTVEAWAGVGITHGVQLVVTLFSILSMIQ